MAQKRISVLGCGWLGLPLATELVKRGYQVKGTTTTESKLPVLEAQGITPLLVTFPENSRSLALTEALDTEVLIFNVPPSRSSTEAVGYEQMLEHVLTSRSPSLRHILFVSSTSVYPDLNRVVTEKDALASPSSTAMHLRCEYLVQQVEQVKSTVVRFGGLMGGSRHPGRFLAGKQNVPSPQGPVNMIHLADAVGIIVQILQQNKWGLTLNACAPEHPTREAFYTKAAHHLHLDPPTFNALEFGSYKIIDSHLLTQELKYSFVFPDPLPCLSSPEF